VPFLDVGDPTHTLSLLKVTLETAIEASDRFGADAADRARWQHLLDHYPEYPMDDGIFTEGDTVPADHYISQTGGLYPVYPCGEFDENSPPEILSAAKKTHTSVDTRQALASYAQAKGRHFVNGWEYFFHIMQALRLGWVRQARALLSRDYLRLFLKPNGLFSHNAIVLADPRESEANLANIPDVTLRDGRGRMPLSEPMASQSGACTGNVEAKEQVFSCIEDSAILVTIVNEMLLQSHNGILRLFPGIAAREDVSFRDLRAEGAFLVSSSIRRGTVEFVTIKGLAGGTLRVRNPWRGKRAFIETGRRVRSGTYGVYIELRFRKNQTITLFRSKRILEAARRRRLVNINTPEPKRLRFYDGSRAWLGKPELSEYYKP
jgi:hypothetical protein